MSTCAIKYRLNAPGPSAFIVDCNGGMRMYTRGKLGAQMPDPYVRSLVSSGSGRWVPATGELILDFEPEGDVSGAWQTATGTNGPFARPNLADLSGSSTASA